MAGETVAVRVGGLRELTRDLKAIERTLPRELGTVMKGAAERTVLPAAREAAPRRSGKLAESLRVGGGTSKVTIRSPVVYANPIHWGWPKHHIKGNPFIYRATDDARMEEFAQELGARLDLFFGEHGF